MAGLLLFPAWMSVSAWYVASNRWLPISLREAWKKLDWNYGIRRKPTDLSTQHVGFGFFDDCGTGLLFETDVGITNEAMYLNFRYLGRLWIRWDRTDKVSRARIPTFEVGALRLPLHTRGH